MPAASDESRHPLVHGMHARALGRVELDRDRLAIDIDAIAELPLNDGYSEYSRGNPGWKNVVLKNASGDPLDRVFGGHDGIAQATPHLAAVPYISELLDSTFAAEHLLWARLFICENGMLIPHRDYLDLPEDEFTRVHLALRVGPNSLHSEQNRVFRMRQGEIWFIDGTVNHAAASYGDGQRIYLSCDFRSGVPFEDLVPSHFDYDGEIIPDFVERQELPADFDQRIQAMVSLIDEHTVDEIVGVLSRTHFSFDAPCGAVYDWVAAAAETVGNTAVADVAIERRQYFLGV